jgi:hypothetical protein
MAGVISATVALTLRSRGLLKIFFRFERLPACGKSSPSSFS